MSIRLLFGVLVCGLFLAGCGQHPNVMFDDSHQRFIEETMAGLSIPETMLDQMAKTSSVSLVSLEKEETGDMPLIALVEDALIYQLLGKGYALVERDADMIARFMAEGRAETYTHTLLPTDLTIRQSGAYGGVRGGRSSWDYYTAGWGGVSSEVMNVHGVGRDSLLTIDTPMKPADYIIAYRILECGLVHRTGDGFKSRQREARVRLHMRLHDAKTGVIVAAQTVENVKTDEVDASAMKWLRNYHYRYYAPDMPVQSGNWGTRYIGGGTKTNDKKPAEENKSGIR